MIPIFQFAIISVLLTAATISDIRTREVSDIFSVGILLTAFLNFNIENLIGLVMRRIRRRRCENYCCAECCNRA